MLKMITKVTGGLALLGAASVLQAAPIVGTDPIFPGTSAADILSQNPGSPDGIYWMDPDGDGVGASQVYADMSTNGGGWSRAYSLDPAFNLEIFQTETIASRGPFDLMFNYFDNTLDGGTMVTGFLNVPVPGLFIDPFAPLLTYSDNDPRLAPPGTSLNWAAIPPGPLGLFSRLRETAISFGPIWLSELLDGAPFLGDQGSGQLESIFIRELNPESYTLPDADDDGLPDIDDPCPTSSTNDCNQPGGNVPVPATLFLFGLGLAGLGFSRKKKA